MSLDWRVAQACPLYGAACYKPIFGNVVQLTCARSREPIGRTGLGV